MQLLKKPSYPGLFNPVFPRELPTAVDRFYAYSGHQMCGPACYVLKYVLERRAGLDVAVWRNTSYSNRHDHCFMVVKEKEDDDDALFSPHLIVDPTARQFWQDDRSESIDCHVVRFVHYELPPVFVGTISELFEVNKRVTDCKAYSYPPDEGRRHGVHKTHADAVQHCRLPDHWKFGKDITARFDLHDCLHDPEYLSMQSVEYQCVIHQIARILGVI